MATPVLAGLAAVARQVLRERFLVSNPSGALMKAVLINAADPRIVRHSRGGYQGSPMERLRVKWALPPAPINAANPSVTSIVDGAAWTTWPAGALARLNWAAPNDTLRVRFAPRHELYVRLQVLCRRPCTATIAAGTARPGPTLAGRALDAGEVAQWWLSAADVGVGGAVWVSATALGPVAVPGPATHSEELLVNLLEYESLGDPLDFEPTTVTCETTGNDLPLHFLGKVDGKEMEAWLSTYPYRFEGVYLIKCPRECASRNDLPVLGITAYHRNSSLCAAAAHLGVLGNPARPFDGPLAVIMRGSLLPARTNFWKLPGAKEVYATTGEQYSPAQVSDPSWTADFPGAFSFAAPITAHSMTYRDGGLMHPQHVGAFDLVPPPPPPAILPASPWTGFGLPALSRALPLSGMERDTRTLLAAVANASSSLTHSESALHCFEIETDPPGAMAIDDTLSVTLVWTDPPAAVGAAFELVNDLDLLLHGFDQWRGAFTRDSRGVVNPTYTAYGNAEPSGDRRNNVEKVMLVGAPLARWCAEVRAHAVPSGRQEYALVVTARQPTARRLAALTARSAGFEPPSPPSPPAPAPTYDGWRAHPAVLAAAVVGALGVGGAVTAFTLRWQARTRRVGDFVMRTSLLGAAERSGGVVELGVVDASF